MHTKQQEKQLKKRTWLSPILLTICLLAVGTSVYLSYVKKLIPKTPVPNEAPTTQHAPKVTETMPQIVLPTEAESTPAKLPSDTKPFIESESADNSAEVLAEKNSVKREANFSYPMEGKPTKTYSNGEMVPSKTMQDWRTHNGVDFAGALGDPVKAINNGIVKAVYDDVLWGTVVEIDHGEGLLAKYCGLGKGSTVSAGDKVKINDKIGNLSEIPLEKADGVHLHLEIFQDGKLVDPLKAMDKS